MRLLCFSVVAFLGLFLTLSASAAEPTVDAKPDVVALVRFVTRDASAQSKEVIPQSSIDFFSGLKSVGLKQKHYTHGRKAGEKVGVYLWDSREQASVFYNKKWRAKMKEKTVFFSVEILDVVVSLDVVAGEFTRSAQAQ